MRFRDFAKSIQKAPKFCEKMNKTADATLLVPTNEAFRFLSASEIEGKISADAERILGLHFIEHMTRLGTLILGKIIMYKIFMQY